MPIEIRELHIKVTVQDGGEDFPWFLPVEEDDAAPRTTEVPRAGEGVPSFLPLVWASDGIDWLWARIRRQA